MECGMYEMGTVAGGMAPVVGGMAPVVGEGKQDPLVRLKSLALIK
jgi:energy-converting hydrogenase Eha subunit E